MLNRSGVGNGSRVGERGITDFCVVKPSEGIHIKGCVVLHMHGLSGSFVQ